MGCTERAGERASGPVRECAVVRSGAAGAQEAAQRASPGSGAWCTVRGMHHAIFGEMKKVLGQMGKWLDTASAHAQAKHFEPDLYLGFRLAPDQFPLSRQIQGACDVAKLAAARLTGREAPKHEDNEKTVAELQARLRAVIAYLDGFAAADFEGADTRVVSQPRWEGRVMSGADYFVEHAIPNFFFHATTAYAILRHNGVELGKRDFLGALSLRAP